MTIYLTVTKHGEDAANVDEEAKAVIACRADIEKEWPIIGKIGRAAEQARGARE
jgi:hypothetical protein